MRIRIVDSGLDNETGDERRFSYMLVRHPASLLISAKQMIAVTLERHAIRFPGWRMHAYRQGCCTTCTSKHVNFTLLDAVGGVK